MKKVVTRFAPSPTGTLHIGGVRTALFNYVYAKKNDGLFLVRIEDTDKERSSKEFEKNILDSLRSIGLSPDLVLSLKTPLDGEVVVKDHVRGDIVFNNSELDDLIILRSDGSPTYHLCNVVDDFEQSVTTVIRGEDHLSNTPRQIHIQKALGYPNLEYAHLPLVLGADKKRLSKRHAATSLEEYKAEGYLDSAILNTLARLGWSKGENEIFYLSDLIKEFEISEVQKAGAIFDITKLNYLNAQHMSNLDINNFTDYLRPYLKDIGIELENHPKSDLLIESMRSSADTLKGIASNLECYYQDVSNFNMKAIEKFIGNSTEILSDLKDKLSNLEIWSESSLDNTLTEYRNEKELSVPKVNQPIRIALTGSTNSPSLGLTMFLFEKEEVIKRINDLIKFVQANN